jgi:signal transduction histidine kinase
MDELKVLWLQTLQTVVDKAAHEIKDSLNGVSLNLEVVRSRAQKEGSATATATALARFAEAASSQLETLTQRTEAMLFLARPASSGTGSDVALALRHLAALLVPAAKADGGKLEVSGWDRPAPTTAPTEAVRLGLASGLLELLEMGGIGTCSLEAGSDAVVRFSHESARTCSLDSAIAASLADERVVIQRGDRGGQSGDLLMVFPGS